MERYRWAVRDRVALLVHPIPIIRPRSGDFCYNATEFEVMLNDVAQVRDMSFPGLVIGLLNADGHVDLAVCGALCTLPAP